METKTVRRKVLPQPERTAALTAIAVAKRKHVHVGIRPKPQMETDRKVAGVLVALGSNTGTGPSQALRKATAAWPEQNSWEVIGSDDFTEFPDDAYCGDEALGDGYFGDPSVYGEFGTVDEPGWMGYPG